MTRGRVVFTLSLLPCLVLLSACAGGGPAATAPPPPTLNPLPVIASVTPSSALVGSPQTPIAISGSGFVSSSTAQWNGTPLTTTFNSETGLSATIPASDFASAAVAQLTVVNASPGGGTSTPAVFAVDNPAPLVTALTPSSALAGSAQTPITVSGSGFVSTSTVQLNGVALPTTFNSSASLTATIPASDFTSAAVAQLTVVNASPGGGTSAPAAFAVDNPSPLVTALTPSSALVGSAQTPITVSGSGFVSTSTVQLNGVALPTTFNSSASLTATIPASSLTSAAVTQLTVMNASPGGGTSTPAVFAVDNPAPLVTALTPSSALVGSAQTPITVSGSGFVSTSTVQLNGVALPTTFNSSASLTATIPASSLTSAAVAQLTVVNASPGGGTSTPAVFAVDNPAPLVTALTPSSALVGSAQTPITVSGSGFVSTSTVQLNGVALPTTFNSSASLTATVPASSLTSAAVTQLTVVNASPGGGTSTPAVFAVDNPAPLVTALTPSSALAGSAQTPITVSGSGFVSTSTVQLNGVALPTTFNSSTSLTATIPASDFTSAAVAQLTVVNASPGGGTSAPAAFAVDNPSPLVTALTPSSALVGSAQTPINVSGSGFVSTSTVQLNGVALPTTFNSSTSLTATVPASGLTNAAVAQLTVVNASPGGGTSTPAAFTVDNPAPTISAINPASVVAGSGDLSLDITGSGFIQASLVAWNGASLATTFISATELKVTLPAADSAGSSQSQITVQNPAPGGGSSLAAAFNVNSPTPVISALSPSSVPPGAAATIAITGTGFESNSSVLWNGSARPTTFLSATLLQVALSAADLQNQGTGSLTVSNPGPAASTSSAASLTVTSQLVPVIQSASLVSGPGFSGGCPQLQVTVTGQNFVVGSTVLANGTSLMGAGGTLGGSADSLTAYLPVNFRSAPGALSLTVSNPGSSGPVVSNPFVYPATSPAALALCATPSPTTVFAGSTFSFIVQPSEVNVSGNGSVTLGTLPTGITSANPTVPLPPNGATLQLQASSTTVAATYDIVLNGTAAGAVAQGDFNFTVSTAAPPGFSFASPLKTEMGVPIGGSGNLQFLTLVNSNSSVDFDITPSVTGLPSGTTASFSPTFFLPGQSVTVTLTAASTAPVTQNASVTLIGTPSAPISNATVSFFADVTQPPGSLPGNRTDFVSTAGTPCAAVYDATHNLIFSSNPSWNRVDVISNATHKILKSIPALAPRWLDITQDNSTVWVQTATANIYAISTTSLQANHYLLPKSSVASSGLPVSVSTLDRVLALSDGTVFIYFNDAEAEGGALAGVWNPQTNQMTVLVGSTPTGLGIPVRSGDGTRVYASGSAAYLSGGVSLYDVATKSFSTINSSTGYGAVIAVNHDGSELVLPTTNAASSITMALYNQNLTLLGPVPGTLAGYGLLCGGVLFSADNTRVYEVAQSAIPAVLTVDATTPTNLKVLGTAPTANSLGGGISATATPFAVDASGIVLGIQDYGISFDDSTFYQNYAATQPTDNGGLINNAVYSGPVAGGTVSSLYVFPQLIPDVWFGQTRGSVDPTQSQLTFTSPPTSTPGPSNVKFIYPDGEQSFAPDLFSYSTSLEYAVASGSPPSGGAPAQLIGFGLPRDASSGTVTVGGNGATITTTVGQYPPFSAEPIPSTVLSYTFPAGTPGFADLTVSTPIGSGTLPKAIYYAKSVTDYSSADTFTFVLFDEKREQVYLSAGDHIDVFSTASNQFVSSISPVAAGSTKQFSGLALTPDGSQLLAADLTDGSLAVINPDTGSSTYIPVAAAGPGINNCEVGPLYVAATSANQAFITFGSSPAQSCPQNGALYIVNLLTHVVTQSAQCSSGQSPESSADGNYVAIGSSPCIYSVQNSTFTLESFPYGMTHALGIAISGDANVVAASQVLGDVNGNMLGALAQPLALYGSTPPLSLHPKLNASGSLYYLDYPSYFEIIDVAHGTLRLRFSLTETIQNTVSPLAIDSGGRFVFLITNQGLTVVDLGSAPLSIGHLSPQSASPGAQVTVRGSGFDSSLTATVGGVAASITFTDENTLTLTIPSATSGPQDIVLTRSDGAIYTLENAVVLP